MEKFFSMDWFKKALESSIDRVVEGHLGSKMNEFIDKVSSEQHDPSSEKIIHKNIDNSRPLKTAKLVNDVLTIVFKDGRVMSRPNSNDDHFKMVVDATNEDDILNIIYDRKVVQEKKEIIREAEKNDILIKGFNVLKKLRDFEVTDNTVILKGTSRTLPPLLVEKFIEVVDKYTEEEDIETKLKEDDEYQSLKNFFMWCCLNPRAEVANQLYNFLIKNSFRITKQGFFVALRNVVTVSAEDNSLVQFISNANNKVKAVWKKNPADYFVYGDKEKNYFFRTATNDAKVFEKGTVLGRLSELYKSLPEMKENRFTDAHTRTFDIRVGKVVNMPPEKCNWSTADCAHAGLHFTADEIHYVGCGDTSVLILINPMKVVGIGEHKGRCYEYLPIMTVPRVEATQILHDVDFDTLQLDEDYAIHELESLEDKVKDGFIAESHKYNFNLPSISSE